MSHTLSRMPALLSSLNSQFASLAELNSGTDCCLGPDIKATQSKFAAAKFSSLRMWSRPIGVSGSLSTKHGTFIITATKPSCFPWSLWKGFLTTQFSEMSDQLEKDDHRTRKAALGKEFAQQFRFTVVPLIDAQAAVERMNTDEMFEFIVRHNIRIHLSQMLWWSCCAAMWMSEMDAATNDRDRIICAKRAQIAHTHSETSKAFLEDELRLTVTVSECETPSG